MRLPHEWSTPRIKSTFPPRCAAGRGTRTSALHITLTLRISPGHDAFHGHLHCFARARHQCGESLAFPHSTQKSSSTVKVRGAQPSPKDHSCPGALCRPHGSHLCRGEHKWHQPQARKTLIHFSLQSMVTLVYLCSLALGRCSSCAST